MACIVKSFDKRTGNTYVYTSYSVWDPVRKIPRPHRHLIGKLNAEGEIVPTGKPGRPRKAVPTAPEGSSADSTEAVEAVSPTYGEFMLVKAELEETRDLLHRQETKNKALDDEVRRLRFLINRLIPSIDAAESSLNELRAICKESEGTT